MWNRRRPLRSVLVALCVLALIALGGGAGAGMRSAPERDAALAAYVLAGGNLSDLCLGGGEEPDSHPSSCKDCTLCKVPQPLLTETSRLLFSRSTPEAGRFERQDTVPALAAMAMRVRAPPHQAG